MGPAAVSLVAAAAGLLRLPDERAKANRAAGIDGSQSDREVRLLQAVRGAWAGVLQEAPHAGTNGSSLMDVATQTDQILKHLKNGGTLTPLEALDKFGCFRLGARIFDLKQEGHAIQT